MGNVGVQSPDLDEKIDLSLSSLVKLPPSYRKIIIDNLGKPYLNNIPLMCSLIGLSDEIKAKIRYLLEYVINNEESIQAIRYELEEYRNDLKPKFSKDFLDEYKGKLILVLDIGAGTGEVTIRQYEELISKGVFPIIAAVERSKSLAQQILENSRRAGIETSPINELSDCTGLKKGIYPLRIDVNRLSERKLEKEFSLTTFNYALDRIPQRSLVKWLQESGYKGWIQATNCIPLQYKNPETGKSYIPEREILIPEGAKDLKEFGSALGLENTSEQEGINTVESLQDGKEKFNYKGIIGKR